MEQQHKLSEDQKDEFIEELNLTPEQIKKDMEEMKSIEGFPIGDDDDILELSNPPYYTAYPNPYIKKFIEKYGKPYDPETDDYKIEPFVGDVAVSKNDMIYRLHSYLTKVPPGSIQQFIEHYTNKGDIVLDAFSGTGMTGIASQTIGRNSILIDLSAAAAFISHHYNKKINIESLKKTISRILLEIEKDNTWLFETEVNGRKAIVNFYVWSINYICPHCKNTLVYYDASYSSSQLKMLDEFPCPSCQSTLTKSDCETILEEVNDNLLNKKIKSPKFTPVLINYSFPGEKSSHEKKIDDYDLEVLKRIDNLQFHTWVPLYKMLFVGTKWGDSWRAGYHSGIEYVHQFYHKRNLYILSILYDKLKKTGETYSLFYFTSLLSRMYRTNRFMPHTNGAGVVGPLSGTLYLSQLQVERNPLEYLKDRLKIHSLAKKDKQYTSVITSTQSSTDLNNVPNNCIDYIFIDPPFGDNLMYSELNFLTESWIKVFTNTKDEAIINKNQKKDLDDYSLLMKNVFEEMFRILKPNRWITVEFHNSRADVWKSIQDGLNKSGFVIAQVAILDKKKGTTKQLTYSGTVKNDLVINAYKPSEDFRTIFLKKAGLNMEKDFIKMHLDKLPIEPNVERAQQMLYSKLLAQYIQNGFEVRMDASEFYGALKNSFIERDGFWFNPKQIPEYEKRVKLKKSIGKFNLDQSILGISDEKSAIIWMAQFLRTPKTYGEISIEFNKNKLESSDKIPEPKQILEENFVTEDGRYRLPSINEKKEKEDARGKRLIKEFNEILQEAQSGKKIKEVRKEALLHGLLDLYNKRDVDQIKLLGSRLDSKIIESDDEIYAIIDWASTKEES
jgi:DNA modification methylase